MFATLPTWSHDRVAPPCVAAMVTPKSGNKVLRGGWANVTPDSDAAPRAKLMHSTTKDAKPKNRDRFVQIKRYIDAT